MSDVDTGTEAVKRHIATFDEIHFCQTIAMLRALAAERDTLAEKFRTQGKELYWYKALIEHLPDGYDIGDDATAALTAELSALKASHEAEMLKFAVFYHKQTWTGLSNNDILAAYTAQRETPNG